MAAISPRFLKRGEKTGEYRHCDEVPARLGDCVWATRAKGIITFYLTQMHAEGEPRVYVSLTYDEAERLGKWAKDCRQGKPAAYEMKTRTYLVDDTHRAKVRGWWGDDGKEWHNAEDTQVECDTCSLSAATVDAIRMMARNGLCICTIGGQKIEWLV